MAVVYPAAFGPQKEGSGLGASGLRSAHATQNKFVIDIVTEFKDESSKKFINLEEKINATMGASAAAFKASANAAHGHSQQLDQIQNTADKLSNKWKNLNKRLKEFSKLSWQGVAGGFLMGGAISHLAGWLDKAIAKVAIFGSELYYMNRRLGLPGTAGLYNVGFAGEQIGLERSSVLATTESMGATARLNPGVAALLSRFLPGYKAGGPIGGKEQLELVNALKKRFGEGGYYMAAQYSQQFGFSNELELRQFWVNIDESNKAFAEHQQRLKDLNINTDATSKSFAMFNRAWNNLTDVLELWATKIGANLASAATPVVNTLANAAQHPSLKAGLLVKGVETAWDLAGSALSGINSGASAAMQYLSGPTPSKGVNSINSKENLINLIQSEASAKGINISREQAIGLMQNAWNESSGNISEFNPAGGGQGALGLWQWRGSRQSNLKAKYGDKPSAQQQVDFMLDEMFTQGLDSGAYAAGQAFKSTPNMSAGEAASIFSAYSERHRNVQETAARVKAAESYANAHPNAAPANDVNIQHDGVHVTINGNVTQDILDRTQSVLNDENQKQAMFMLNAVRGANFR